jgi:V/A-type H+/Na+-transporting ATPase subunit I
MAIAEMTQVLILGRKRDQLEVAKALQAAGVVHIDPVEGADLPRTQLTGVDAETRSRLERQLARSESVLAAVGGGNVAPDALRLRAINNREAFLDEIGGSSDKLAQQKAELESELNTVNLYGTSARAAADLAGTLDRSSRVSLLAFTFADAEELGKLERSLNEGNLAFSVGHKPTGAVSTGVLAVRREDLPNVRTALTRSGLGELRFPGRFETMPFGEAASAMEAQARSAPSELTRINAELSRIKSEHAGSIAHARLELRDEIGQYQALETGVNGQYGFALRGWVPTLNRSKLETFLLPMKDRLVYEFEGAPTHHAEHVPVKLENNPIFKPFELLLGIFAPPAYGAFDPTWVLAICFPLFFGFVIGDIGLGAISMAIALLFRSMSQSGQSLSLGPLGIVVPPKPLLNVSTVLAWMAGWSIFFGFIYGELFGTLGEHLHLFYVPGHSEGSEVEKGLFPILVHRVDPNLANFMMTIVVFAGILQILYGWALRVKAGIDHGDDKHKWEGMGMFIGLVGIILIAYTFRNPGTPGFVNLIGYGCIVAFFVFAYLTARHDGILGGMMPIELLSNGGNILSYLRLYAVGLSSAILANLATDAAWNLGMSIGPIGLILGILVGTLIHLFAIVFTIIGHVLQPLRLHYAEFFTKFGFYEASGRPYKPFARTASENAGGN